MFLVTEWRWIKDHRGWWLVMEGETEHYLHLGTFFQEEDGTVRKVVADTEGTSEPQ